MLWEEFEHKILKKDQAWHPGKIKPDAEKRGPKVKFTIAKQKLVARSAMALKNPGLEPTVASVLARCGKAANNPETGESFSVPTVTKVFKTLCYDQDPTVPWSFASPFRRQRFHQTSFKIGWLGQRKSKP